MSSLPPVSTPTTAPVTAPTVEAIDLIENKNPQVRPYARSALPTLPSSSRQATQTEMQKIQAALTSLLEALNDAQARVTALEGAVNTVAGNISALSAGQSQLADALNETMQAHAQTVTAVQALISLLPLVQASITDLYNRQNATQNELSGLSNNVSINLGSLFQRVANLEARG